MTFVEQAELAENGEFQARVRQAAIFAAVEIMAWVPVNTPQAIEAHRRRAAFASTVLREPTNYQRALAMSVASNPGLTGPQANDGDIQYTVNSMWDAWSGVTKDPAVA
jgi:hypothetical protein